MRNIISILLHRDTAFAGQGVVFETLQMTGVDVFNVGGTAFNCLIFHVNDVNPIAIARLLETAIEWRHEWGTDVVIDMICYCCLGHNKMNQSMFT